MKQYIYASSAETARALILHLINLISEEPRKIFNIAFSGGSTPALMFDLWANEYSVVTPWDRIRIWWVDERCVRPENSDSNYGMMRMLLLDIVPIPESNIFRIEGESNPEEEAVRYSGLAKKYMQQQSSGMPAFDIVLLGAGNDGHTSSIFQGQEHLLISPNVYEVSCNPHNAQKRIALTGQSIINAGRVIFFIMGKDKADVVAEICMSGDTCPAAYVAHHANKVELFLDEAAAVKLQDK
ncbi:6-phosphogluconolactonase [uncultured Bacteroides sp.]|uniref:6-phosphogluconolactonase n=1 Tax=uncultured Bacteroides sp. TaxID=162156 RepID=UPI002AA8D8D5|nr:6-phosphogluconolactonase [uncultured Bacteroides sp.]